MRLRDKKLLMSKKSILKGSKIFINDDIPNEVRIKESILRKASKKLTQDNPGSKTQLRRGQLIHKNGPITEVFEIDSKGEVVKLQSGLRQHQDMDST
jgi:hypothetical protein